MQSKTTARLLQAAILTAFASLPFGCKSSGAKPARPELPIAFHYMEPGSTNTVVVPIDCGYGIWTTDRGLLYLQGLTPSD